MKYIRATSLYGFALADHVREVGAHVELRVDGDLLVALVLQVVDEGGDHGDLRHDVAAVFVHRIPGLGLVHLPELYRFAKTATPSASPGGRWRASSSGWVSRGSARRTSNTYWGTICRAFHSSTTSSTCSCVGTSPVSRKYQNDFDGRILGPGDLGQRRERLGDRLAAEADPLLRVEVGDVGHEAADVAGAADALVDGHLVDDDLPVLLDQLGRARTVGQDLLQEFRLEVRHVCASPFVGFFCDRCHGPCLLSGGEGKGTATVPPP